MAESLEQIGHTDPNTDREHEHEERRVRPTAACQEGRAATRGSRLSVATISCARARDAAYHTTIATTNALMAFTTT